MEKNMLIQMPSGAKRLELPAKRGKNTSFDWLKSINGQSWLRKHVKPAIGLTRNGKMVAFIPVDDAIFTIHYTYSQAREFHAGFAGMNAGKYKGPTTTDVGLIVKRFDIRQGKFGPRLIKKAYEIFVEL